MSTSGIENEVFHGTQALVSVCPYQFVCELLICNVSSNTVTSPDLGFMVGAMGMMDASCTGQFGIPVLDTFDGKLNVYYFPINELNSYDNYDKIVSCFQERGISGCYHLATLWSSTPLEA